MCSDIGALIDVPSKEEIVSMGCGGDVCGSCTLYRWHSMLGVWQIEDGWCSIKMKQGGVDAKSEACRYANKRRDI